MPPRESGEAFCLYVGYANKLAKCKSIFQSINPALFTCYHAVLIVSNYLTSHYINIITESFYSKFGCILKFSSRINFVTNPLKYKNMSAESGALYLHKDNFMNNTAYIATSLKLYRKSANLMEVCSL